MNKLLASLALATLASSVVMIGCTSPTEDPDVDTDQAAYSLPFKFARQTRQTCQFVTDKGATGQFVFTVNESEGFGSAAGRSRYQVKLAGSAPFVTADTQAFATFQNIRGNQSGADLIVDAFTPLHAGWDRKIVSANQAGPQGSIDVAGSRYYALVNFNSAVPRLAGEFLLVSGRDIAETRTFSATCTR